MTSRACYEESLAVERASGAPEGLMAALHEFGHYLDYAGDAVAARCLAVLGNIALSQGGPAEAAGPLRGTWS